MTPTAPRTTGVRPRQRQRLVVVSRSFWPHEGGAERQLRDVLGHAHVLADWDVHVVTDHRPGRPGREAVQGATVHRSPDGAVARRSPAAAFARHAVASLVRLRPDVVVSSAVGAATAAAGAYAFAARIPHVVRLTSSPMTTADGMTTADDPLLLRPGARAVLGPILGSSRTTIVAPARHLVESAAGHHPRRGARLRHIPNGVRVAGTSVPGVRVASAAGGDRLLADVLWYGRDDWYKNPAAFRQLASACPDVSFATIGRADLPASDNVRDLGWRDDVAALLPRVRVLLMTSRFEGSPNLALQSLACGVPIAAFDIAATRELAADHPARVFLAPPGDIAGLRAALSDALDTGPGEPADVPSLNDVRNQWLDLLSGLAPRLA